MDIVLINQYLKEGKTVKEIRELLGYSEKNFQQNIKALGYKYNQKNKQYILKNIEIMPTSSSNTTCTTTSNINLITNNNDQILNLIKDIKEQEESIKFIHENIQDFKEIMAYYKRNKECNINNHGIVINLIDDKELDDGKPTSFRVNKHVLNDWKEFTKDINYSSKELISMALKEYMEKYK